MSIQTNALPSNSNIRSSKSSNLSDISDTRKNNEPVDVEISLPMLFVLLLGIAALIWGGVYLYKSNKSKVAGVVPLPDVLTQIDVPVTVTLTDVLKTGESKTGYFFIEYSDFECPYCKTFAVGDGTELGKKNSTVSNIKRDYVDTKKLNYGYAPYIVASHKPAASNEVLGYYCAMEQNKAAEFAELVFTKTYANGAGIDKKGSSAGSIIGLAKELGLDESKFTECYNKSDIAAADSKQNIIETEVASAWANKYGDGTFGTPFFVVCKTTATDANKCEGKAFVGGWPFADIKGLLDGMLKN